MDALRILLALAIGSVGLSEGFVIVCPWDDPSLTRWTTRFAGANHQVNTVITEPILLDTSLDESTGIESITVSGEGMLVWDPKSDIHIRLRYLLIKDGGRVDIGSEKCRYERKTSITLYGKRNDMDNIEGFGQKFIGVDAGGTLEIHGKRKYPWTKLDGTVSKVGWGAGLKYKFSVISFLQHRCHDGDLFSYSFYFISILSIVYLGRFNLLSKAYNFLFDSAIVLVRDFVIIPGTANGEVLVISKRYKIKTKYLPEMAEVWDSLKSKAGVSHLEGQNMRVDRDAYVFPDSTREVLSVETNAKGEYLSTASLTAWDLGVRFDVISMFTDSWRRESDIIITNTDYSYPIVTVIDDVTSWEIGDKVILTSTDYDMDQAEVGTVMECDSCSSYQVRLDLMVKYDHFGEIIEEVDERGEVALLTRNILIQGELQDKCVPTNENCPDTIPKPKMMFPQDTFGGHLMVRKDFKNAHFEGAEFYHMGQQSDLGRYSIHFHMVGEAGPAQYEDPPRVSSNSIHDSLSRCVTVHGTHGLVVENNVCVNTLGHSYFLEDGGERNTALIGNLGCGTQKGSLIPADKKPATFWITNPLTILRDNVAAGSVHTGIWYLYPDEPIGPSAGKGWMAKGEALNTPITEFNNNVGHSNYLNGLNIDFKLTTSSDVGGSITYKPQDKDGNPVKVYLQKGTFYKNGIQNVWIRSKRIVVSRFSLADSPKGITVAGYENFVENSVILGETANKGLPEERDGVQFDRSRPTWDATRPMSGITWYDGPTYYSGIYFNHFDSNQIYDSYALGYRRENKFSNSVSNEVKMLSWGSSDEGTSLGETRVFDQSEGYSKHYGDLDGDRSATFCDADGSVSGRRGWYIKNKPFLTTDQCNIRANWGDIALCPYEYGKLDFILRGRKTQVNMVRDDNQAELSLSPSDSCEFPVILGGLTSYIAYFDSFVPNKIAVYGRGIKKGSPVRLGICIGQNLNFENGDFTLSQRSDVDGWNDPWVEVNSVEELDRATKMKNFYYDGAVGAIFFKFQSYKNRTDDTIAECPDGECPYMELTIDSPMTTQFKCTDDAYLNGYKVKPQGLGAGATKPFRENAIVNGGWGEWSDWGPCSVTCEGGTQSRTRMCNNPLPSGGGQSCTGERSQEQDCNPDTCPPVDGGFSDWVTSSCVEAKDGICYQEKNRDCTDPEPSHHGQYCNGALKKVVPCECGPK
ncbi:hypothetical protein ScPMuIL_010866 [Solemya velum]